MGFRTVVILYNDQASEWSEDPQLGKKIYLGTGYASMAPRSDWNSPTNLHYGNIVESEHADTTSLFAVDGYYARRLFTGHNSIRQKADEVDLELLRGAAKLLGYKLIKAS